MKRPVLAALLALALPVAQAAPPTPAQVDALLVAMDARNATARMIEQMETSTREMVKGAFGEPSTPEERARIERILADQRGFMHQLLDWDTLGPIYRKVYAETFSADEIEAITRFYASPEGRAVASRMPLVMERVAKEMQPLLQSLMQEVQQAVTREAAAVERG